MARTMAVPKLQGTIGPGFTISLKAGAGDGPVLGPRALEREVVDARLVGDDQGVVPVLERRNLLAVSVLGGPYGDPDTKKGTYRIYCTVHPTVSSTFKVT